MPSPPAHPPIGEGRPAATRIEVVCPKRLPQRRRPVASETNALVPGRSGSSRFHPHGEPAERRRGRAGPSWQCSGGRSRRAAVGSAPVGGRPAHSRDGGQSQRDRLFAHPPLTALGLEVADVHCVFPAWPRVARPPRRSGRPGRRPRGPTVFHRWREMAPAAARRRSRWPQPWNRESRVPRRRSCWPENRAG